MTVKRLSAGEVEGHPRRLHDGRNRTSPAGDSAIESAFSRLRSAIAARLHRDAARLFVSPETNRIDEAVRPGDWHHVELETDQFGTTITHCLDDTGEYVTLESPENPEAAS
jgi:ssDNA-binding replication factor A large subunit